jgi:hypothetical protein
MEGLSVEGDQSADSICMQANSQYHGQDLWDRLTLTHGYLNKKGYCYNGDCQVFPVMYGEMGSHFTDQRDIQVHASRGHKEAQRLWGCQLTKQRLPLQMMPDLSMYMNNWGGAADGQHEAITSWFWWAWGPGTDSGNAPGIVRGVRGLRTHG